MEILIPVWPERTLVTTATDALRSLEGVDVALVDDGLDPDFTAELEAELRRSFGAVVKRLDKPSHNAGSPAAMIDEAARCKVAVVGIAL